MVYCSIVLDDFAIFCFIHSLFELLAREDLQQFPLKPLQKFYMEQKYYDNCYYAINSNLLLFNRLNQLNQWNYTLSYSVTAQDSDLRVH